MLNIEYGELGFGGARNTHNSSVQIFAVLDLRFIFLSLQLPGREIVI